MASIEMAGSYSFMSIPVRDAPSPKKVTILELIVEAAKTKYGNNIKVLIAPWATCKWDSLKFEITVVSAEMEPKEARRTIVDINMKEYTNHCETEVDETLVRISKKSNQSEGSRYKFSNTTGIDWGIEGGIGANIGAKVMSIATAGGSASLTANYGKQKSTTTEEETTKGASFEYCYEQEEKIKIPPMTQVKAKIITYSMNYEQGYTLKCSLPSTLSIQVWYKTKCQQICCGKRFGYISAGELLQSLPGYSEEDDKVSFLQPGILSWNGEGSSINKVVEPLK